jgi:hypothetical protein
MDVNDGWGLLLVETVVSRTDTVDLCFFLALFFAARDRPMLLAALWSGMSLFSKFPVVWSAQSRRVSEMRTTGDDQ